MSYLDDYNRGIVLRSEINWRDGWETKLLKVQLKPNTVQEEDRIFGNDQAIDTLRTFQAIKARRAEFGKDLNAVGRHDFVSLDNFKELRDLLLAGKEATIIEEMEGDHSKIPTIKIYDTQGTYSREYIMPKGDGEPGALKKFCDTYFSFCPEPKELSDFIREGGFPFRLEAFGPISLSRFISLVKSRKDQNGKRDIEGLDDLKVLKDTLPHLKQAFIDWYVAESSKLVQVMDEVRKEIHNLLSAVKEGSEEERILVEAKTRGFLHHLGKFYRYCDESHNKLGVFQKEVEEAIVEWEKIDTALQEALKQYDRRKKVIAAIHEVSGSGPALQPLRLNEATSYRSPSALILSTPAIGEIAGNPAPVQDTPIKKLEALTLDILSIVSVSEVKKKEKAVTKLSREGHDTILKNIRKQLAEWHVLVEQVPKHTAT